MPHRMTPGQLLDQVVYDLKASELIAADDEVTAATLSRTDHGYYLVLSLLKHTTIKFDITVPGPAGSPYSLRPRAWKDRKPKMGEPGWSTATNAPPGVEG